MAKIKNGSKVWIDSIKDYGVVVDYDQDNGLVTVNVNGVLKVMLQEAVTVISLIKEIWLLLKSIFKKNQ